MPNMAINQTMLDESQITEQMSFIEDPDKKGGPLEY